MLPAPTMPRMANKKTQTAKTEKPAGKKAQPGHIVRIREDLYAVVSQEAEADYSNPTAMTNLLIREALAARGKWPQPDKGRST